MTGGALAVVVVSAGRVVVGAVRATSLTVEVDSALAACSDALKWRFSASRVATFFSRLAISVGLATPPWETTGVVRLAGTVPVVVVVAALVLVLVLVLALVPRRATNGVVLVLVLGLGAELAGTLFATPLVGGGLVTGGLVTGPVWAAIVLAAASIDCFAAATCLAEGWPWRTFWARLSWCSATARSARGAWNGLGCLKAPSTSPPANVPASNMTTAATANLTLCWRRARR